MIRRALSLFSALAIAPASVDAAATDARAHAPARAEPAQLEDVMARLAAIPGLRARFEETKTIGLLAEPLVTRGTLWFAPPGRLLRKTDAPNASRVLLVDDELWVSEGGRSERIDLGNDPAVRSFVASFRSLLSGDAEALQRHFRLTLTSEDGDWVLALVPKTEGMRKIVRRMEAAGRGAVLKRLVVEEPNGDVSRTRFFDVDATHVIGPDAIARLFAPPR